LGTKLELALVKASKENWAHLETTGTQSSEPKEITAQGSLLNYPSSSRIKHDWSQFESPTDLAGEQSQSPDEFFKKLYANAGEDTQRAMMKSFIESGGTVLSTNWQEVGGKKVDPAPPAGVKYDPKK
jgi:suppressor of G2 allele of SKP1